jgi:hypothetical protein
MLLPLFAWLVGCQPAEQSICQDLCIELVTSCAYAAYPSVDSCMQGCGYAASQGVDVDAQAECVFAAECDTFTIIECEHEYGLEAATGAETSG